jgi:cytochrome c-type biogenesis protein
VIDLDALRLGFAFSAGVATFFAPCAYPLLPGYVAYYLGRGESNTNGAAGSANGAGSVTSAGGTTGARLRRAAFVGLLVSAGFVLVYAALAGVVLAAGARLLSNVAVLELVVGALLVVLGVAMALGRGPQLGHLALPERRRSAVGFVAFGVVYAAAAAGCTAPVFVAVALAALSGGPATALATLGAYAAGMSLLMVAVTVASALGRDALLRRLPDPGRVSRAAGALLALAGVAQIYLFVFAFDGLATLGLA